MKYCIVSLSLGILLLFMGCSGNNSVEQHFELIPEQGETPLPTIADTDSAPLFKPSPDSLKAKSNTTVYLNQLKPLLEHAQKQLGKDHVAVFSVQDTAGSWYAYYVEELIFPDSLRSNAHSKTMTYLYYEDSEDGNPPRVAVAMIPAHSEALKLFDDWIKPKKNIGDKTNQKLKGCDYEKIQDGYWTCAEDVITGESACGYTPPTYDYVCSGSGSGTSVYEWPTTGGGGGFGSSPTPSCERNSLIPKPDCPCPSDDMVKDEAGHCIFVVDDPEPCNTGNPILDDEGIQVGFQNMWEDSKYGNDSNPNPESQRKEQVGFIVPNGFGGYQLQRLSSSFITDAGPCAVSFKAPANLPQGTIFVHTHPYSKGGYQNHCLPGRTIEYDNVPGVEDRPTLDILGLDQGIILDADKIIQFTPNESVQPTLIDRCGY